MRPKNLIHSINKKCLGALDCPNNMTCDKTKMCKLKEGQPCVIKDDCTFDAFCDGKCAVKTFGSYGKLSQKCPCNSGLECHQKSMTCKISKKMRCVNNSDCITEICDKNKCTYGSIGGAPCQQNSDCISKFCSKGFCQTNKITGEYGAFCFDGCMNRYGASCNKYFECISKKFSVPGICSIPEAGLFDPCNVTIKCHSELSCLKKNGLRCDSYRACYCSYDHLFNKKICSKGAIYNSQKKKCLGNTNFPCNRDLHCNKNCDNSPTLYIIKTSGVGFKSSDFLWYKKIHALNKIYSCFVVKILEGKEYMYFLDNEGVTFATCYEDKLEHITKFIKIKNQTMFSVVSNKLMLFVSPGNESTLTVWNIELGKSSVLKIKERIKGCSILKNDTVLFSAGNKIKKIYGGEITEIESQATDPIYQKDSFSYLKNGSVTISSSGLYFPPKKLKETLQMKVLKYDAKYINEEKFMLIMLIKVYNSNIDRENVIAICVNNDWSFVPGNHDESILISCSDKNFYLISGSCIM